MIRLLLLALLLAAPACGKRGPTVHNRDGGPATLELPDTPLVLDLGPGWLANPLDLWDMGIGSPEHELAARLDGQPIKVRELDDRAGNVFHREGERIYAARERGWRWLVERAALERGARAAKADLRASLRASFATLPEPADPELTAIAAQMGMAGIADVEDRIAVRSIWRGQKWAALRSLLVARGADGMEHRRIQVDIFARTALDPAQIIGRVDGRAITRHELRALAADDEETARDEYQRLIGMQVEVVARDKLRAREAARRGITVDALVKEALAAAPPIRDAEVRAFLKAEPTYAADPRGADKARDVLRRLRVAAAEKALDDRLRAPTTIEVFPRAVQPLQKADEIVRPLAARTAGAASGPLIVLYHGLGCDRCDVGARLLGELLAAHGGKARIASADSFQGFAGYRAALALHCAAEQGKWTELHAALAARFERGAVGELTDRAAAAGLDAAAFRTCMESDRYLPDIEENRLQAARLGIPAGEPGLFVDGVTIWSLDEPDKLAAQLKPLL